MATEKKKQKHAGGRPRTLTPDTYTPAQLKEIDEWAEAQAKDTTIAVAMGIDVDTFKRDFASRTEQKRAQGKLKVLTAQGECAKRDDAGHVTDRIWFGKQHLEQSDKNQIQHDVTDELGDLLREISGTRILPTD